MVQRAARGNGQLRLALRVLREQPLLFFWSEVQESVEELFESGE